MGKAFLITFGLLGAILIFVIFRTGYFKPVEITSGEQGPFVLVYKKHTGAYHKIAGVIDGVEKSFKENNIKCPLFFGRFLHDPKTVPQDRLESHGGCAFPSPPKDLLGILEKLNLESDTVEKKEYLVALFEGSPSVGPFRVYPKVEKWMAKYGYKMKSPVIELYQTTGPDSLRTRYLIPYE